MQYLVSTTMSLVLRALPFLLPSTFLFERKTLIWMTHIHLCLYIHLCPYAIAFLVVFISLVTPIYMTCSPNVDQHQVPDIL